MNLSPTNEVQEVRIAFYKARKGKWTDWVISGWTWIFNPTTKPYSHVEIGFCIGSTWKYFSSSIRDGGTRWKNASKLLKNKNRWDIYTKDFFDNSINRMLTRASNICNKRYDKLGIMGFLTITGQVLNKKDKWYCSEAVFYVLTGFWKKRISPRRLSKRISKEWNLV